MIRFMLISIASVLVASCSHQKLLSKPAQKHLIKDDALAAAHIGISVYEPSTGKYWCNFQADKYFTPASNVKIVTCYAAMKYLGDSLVGVRLKQEGNKLWIFGTGDPSFLHPDYPYQPVFDYLKKMEGREVILVNNQGSGHSGARAYAMGWSWDDYGEYYMPERSFFPIYGNVARFSIDSSGGLMVIPGYFRKQTRFKPDETKDLTVTRSMEGNSFMLEGSKPGSRTAVIPFKTKINYEFGKYSSVTTSLLSDTLDYNILYAEEAGRVQAFKKISSQPTDSVLKLMMHRSDNFFAEQSLLMVSNELLGTLDEAITDTLLRRDLGDLPQPPRWVDGSGLSRYNLFTPQDMVWILDKMRRDFGMDRIREIFPEGGEGTLENYYRATGRHLIAKTGTLSGVVALSGFLYTRKNRLLIFSVLVNNHRTSAGAVRRAVERFLTGLREDY